MPILGGACFGWVNDARYDVWFQRSNNADEVIADEQVQAVEGIVAIPLSAADKSAG